MPSVFRRPSARFSIERSGRSITWWHIPYPLQAIDGVNSLTWHMLRPANMFRAAAQAPVGCVISRSSRVTGVTRTGVVKPAATSDGPRAVFTRFWHTLVSQRDEIRQKRPYSGLDSLPQSVMHILARDGWCRALCVVRFLPSEVQIVMENAIVS